MGGTCRFQMLSKNVNRKAKLNYAFANDPSVA